MSFKKITGRVSTQNPNGEAKVLFRATAINAAQMTLTREIIEHFANVAEPTEEQTERWAKGIYTRKELRDAHGVLRGKKAAPYFISKNVACKVTNQHGCYCVTRLKLSAASAAVEPTTEEQPVPTVKKKKIASSAKKEAKPRRENRNKEIEAPASTEIETTA
jgi:hypothetical protein